MKIAIITSSPHRDGTSALLADEFMRGAEEAGHSLFRFDAAFEKVSPCLACGRCGRGEAPCAQRDAMDKLNPELLAADAVVFVTPLYYFGMSAQLKTVIDRFYANNKKLKGSGKKAVLLATANSTHDRTFNALALHYRTIIDYLEWKDTYMLLAVNSGTRSMIEQTDYPSQAYRMGKEIGQ